MDSTEPEPSKGIVSWIPRRLRERHWFWPKAAWIGFGWFGRIVDHPLSSFLAWVLALATIFLGGIVLHISLLILCFVVLLAFLFVVARGARLKWEQDRCSSGGSSGPPAGVSHIGTYMHEPKIYNLGEDPVVAASLLRQIKSIETDLPVPPGDPPVSASEEPGEDVAERE